ncbi:MAG TPA: DNA packaging protein [Pseudoxanthomonas sp.]
MAAVPAWDQSDAAIAELRKNLSNPMWRLCNLYWIMVKGDADEEGLVIKFQPNRAQRRFLSRLWHRNIILKARQLGFTTLIALLWLDHALFNKNQRCGIVAQDKDAAEAIFRDKVRFAYDHLPPVLKAEMPLKRDSAHELLFDHNNSAIKVATSLRSGTFHRLHVSEFGKICAMYPQKAREVITGSIPAVPKSGITIIESTAEGRGGEYYKMTKRAEELAQQGKTLTVRDYRFHFYPWWEEPGYRMSPIGVTVTDDDRDYFAGVEAETGTTLDAEQRAWYVATRDTDFTGDPEKMWQEYPSTPDEAFQVSKEGCYYAKQLVKARTEGRIARIPHRDGVPVNTFWDLGKNDFQSIWFHQAVGMQNNFIRSYQNSGEFLPFYAQYIQEMAQKHGYVYGVHYLPHDAESETINGRSARFQLEELLPGHRFEVVKRIERRIDGINQTRAAFSSCFFDEENCADGLVSLGEYRKQFNKAIGAYTEDHVHDEHSNFADAFRQFAQGYPGAQIHIAAAEPEWKRKLRQRHAKTRRRSAMSR